MLESDQFARILHIDMERLNLFTTHGWIIPLVIDGRPTFEDVDLARAALIVDLTDEMGVNNEGIDVILDLLDQLYSLRIAFAGLLASVETGHGASGLNGIHKLDAPRPGK